MNYEILVPPVTNPSGEYAQGAPIFGGHATYANPGDIIRIGFKTTAYHIGYGAHNAYGYNISIRVAGQEYDTITSMHSGHYKGIDYLSSPILIPPGQTHTPIVIKLESCWTDNSGKKLTLKDPTVTIYKLKNIETANLTSIFPLKLVAPTFVISGMTAFKFKGALSSFAGKNVAVSCSGHVKMSGEMADKTYGFELELKGNHQKKTDGIPGGSGMKPFLIDLPYYNIGPDGLLDVQLLLNKCWIGSDNTTTAKRQLDFEPTCMLYVTPA